LGDIPHGQETRVLLRHGFSRWEDLYPRRQRVLLEHLLDQAQHCSTDAAVVAAVRMAVVGSAEMAGHLSRWDRYYLKSFESMAGHRFNFTTLAVEPNVWGTVTSGRGTTLRRLAQLVRAAEWMERQAHRRLRVVGPLDAGTEPGDLDHSDSDVVVVEGSSERMLLADGAADLVLTDPPYHDDVQYSELSLPLRAWAGLSAQPLSGEAVVNAATGQLAEPDDYGRLLNRIFAESARVLRRDGHLVFSYANRSPAAWIEVLRALDAAN
jgi:putative DNA methylase